MNPFLVLNVGVDDDDETVRQAYLKHIKKYPSDTFPYQFSLISEAYELIKTKRLRYGYVLFPRTTKYNSPMEVLKNNISLPHRRKPLSLKNMKELLKECAKR